MSRKEIDDILDKYTNEGLKAELNALSARFREADAKKKVIDF